LNSFFQCLFLLFYVVSSYAISQQRIANIVSRVQRSRSNTDLAQVNSDGALQKSDFPNYRQAKPKTMAIARVSQITLHDLPRVTGSSFESVQCFWKSTRSNECILSRAPPHQI
jgi:hypothetical protein